MRWKHFKSLLCILPALIVMSCARSSNPDVERGSDYKYKPGYPELRFSALGFMESEDQGYINIAGDIVRGSLIYKKKEENFSSKCAVEIQITNQENDQRVVKNSRYTVTIDEENSNVVYSQDHFSFQKKIPIPPGKYSVKMSVKDLYSKKQTTRTSTAFIPDPKAEATNLTNIRMLGKEIDQNKGWLPITTYYVPGKIDSVKFIVQAAHKSPEPLIVESKLFTYEADTTTAEPMHFGFTSSIHRNGINYDNNTVIQSSQRTLKQRENVFLEFKFPILKKGNYRFEINGKEDAHTTFLKGRDFAIKSTYFPSLKTPRELARPLTYLMDKNAYKELMSISDSDSLRQAVDKFWLKTIGNKYKAKSIIRLYYERVEEANKKFSNYKEGWKTDRGMIYILFGPPWYVKNNLRTETRQWSYSHDHYSSELNFFFIQSHIKSEFFPFDNYLLNRSNTYFQTQYQQIQLWKSGLILTDRI